MSLRAAFTARRGAFEISAILDVADGETLALLGPNGAGKSTIVDVLAGALDPREGTIEIDGERVDTLPAERRPIGVCFQDDLLFPHLTALENVAFPLRARGTGRAEAHGRGAELLARLAVSVDPHAKPTMLSGGERQRVALARALAPGPRLLLLDEPFSNVDVSARAGLRALVREVTAGFDGATVLVAHDPIDALTLADRVTLLEAGRQTQTGTPDEIRAAPRSAYAADLVGVNLFRGMLEPLPDGAARLVTARGTITVAPETRLDRAVPAIAILKPIDIAIHAVEPEGSPRNVVHGRVGEITIDGERARIRVDGEPPLTAEITTGSLARLGLTGGTDVWASFKAVEVSVILTEEGAAPGTLSW
jgi:molybdate transport system ATP-binding protein